MELIFNKTNQNVYEAVFEAPADFNLHIERKSTGSLIVKQGISADGEFADAANFGLNAGKIINSDFAALVYPKFIKVVSGSEVVSASVNFNEGGGSGSGSSNDIEYTYLDLRGFDIDKNNDFLNIIPFASVVNYKGVIAGRDIHYIMSYGYLALVTGNLSSILGLAIDESFMVTNMATPDSEQICSVKELIEMTTAKDLYNSLPRITKEQFYNLDA